MTHYALRHENVLLNCVLFLPKNSIFAFLEINVREGVSSNIYSVSMNMKFTEFLIKRIKHGIVPSKFT